MPVSDSSWSWDLLHCLVESFHMQWRILLSYIVQVTCLYILLVYFFCYWLKELLRLKVWYSGSIRNFIMHSRKFFFSVISGIIFQWLWVVSIIYYVKLTTVFSFIGYHVCKTFGKIIIVTYLTIHNVNLVYYGHAINCNNFLGIKAKFFFFASVLFGCLKVSMFCYNYRFSLG